MSPSIATEKSKLAVVQKQAGRSHYNPKRLKPFCEQLEKVLRDSGIPNARIIETVNEVFKVSNGLEGKRLTPTQFGKVVRQQQDTSDQSWFGILIALRMLSPESYDDWIDAMDALIIEKADYYKEAIASKNQEHRQLSLVPENRHPNTKDKQVVTLKELIQEEMKRRRLDCSEEGDRKKFCLSCIVSCPEAFPLDVLNAILGDKEVQVTLQHCMLLENMLTNLDQEWSTSDLVEISSQN